MLKKHFIYRHNLMYKICNLYKSMFGQEKEVLVKCVILHIFSGQGEILGLWLPVN